MKLFIKTFVVLSVLAGLVLAAIPYGKARLAARNKISYRHAKVSRGEVVYSVTATGTVQPVRRVSVGSFISGPIASLLVDYNSEVHKGELMAKLDPRIQEANVARDEASLATSHADRDRILALLEQATHDEERALKLRKTNPRYISEAEMDQFKYAKKSLEAQLAVAEAAGKQAEANLRLSRASLEYTDIVSPVDGIVIDRKIDPGQTVAAAFQTPELFIVAPEMNKRMHILASVDEADIGYIRTAQSQNQKVEFTVDAYPDDLFHGKINQIRLNPTTNLNVVTYTVVVEAPNPERKLLPGMTATLSFHISRHSDVLRIPNAALRFYPKVEQVREEDRPILEGGEDDTRRKKDEGEVETTRSAQDRVKASRNRNLRHVWAEDGDFLRAIQITTGISDNQQTQLIAGELKDGEELVTGVHASRP
jgi:HlyD family secretion protein